MALPLSSGQWDVSKSVERTFLEVSIKERMDSSLALSSSSSCRRSHLGSWSPGIVKQEKVLMMGANHATFGQPSSELH